MRLSKTKVYADYRRNPETRQYEKKGNQALTLTLEDCKHLVFTREKFDGKDEKKVTVKPTTGDFIYQVKKNFIRAKGEADGLFGFLTDPDADDCYFSMFDKVFDYMN